MSASADGLVTELRAGVGDEVKQGDVLAVMESLSLVVLQREFLQAVTQQKLSAAEFKRGAQLFKEGIIAAFGLVPLLFATGPGSEIQRPLAIVVIGGLITSMLLTLVLLPILYRRYGAAQSASVALTSLQPGYDGNAPQR